MMIDIISSSEHSGPMLTPAQIRAARSMLNWKQADLAKKAGLSLTGLNNIERGAADPRASTLVAIQRALEAAGIEFISENGGGPGVRLRKKASRRVGKS
jgi:transcriptional regulator with XRE-family HTH domain